MPKVEIVDRVRARRVVTLAISLFVGSHAATAAAQSSSSYNQAEWAKTVAAAHKEGKVTYYTALTPLVSNRLVDGFRKAYPKIVVEHIRHQTGALLSKLEQERAGGFDGADIAMSTDMVWATARAKEGALLRPSGPASSTWPGKYFREGTNGTVVIGALEPIVIVYNTAQVANPPKGYADMLRAEFKGRIATTVLASTVVVAWYDWLEKTQGKDYLLKLRALDPKLSQGSTTLSQSVAAGEFAIGTQSTTSATKPLMDQGAPINFVVPNPGLGFGYSIIVPAWGKRPNAGLVFADYLMSREGQAIWHGRGDTASPLEGIPGSLRASEITPLNPDLYPPEVVNKYNEYWNKIFK